MDMNFERSEEGIPQLISVTTATPVINMLHATEEERGEAADSMSKCPNNAGKKISQALMANYETLKIMGI